MSFNFLPNCVWQRVSHCCFNLHVPDYYGSCVCMYPIYIFLSFCYICFLRRSPLQWITARVNGSSLFQLFVTWCLQALETSMVTLGPCRSTGHHFAPWVLTLPVTLYPWAWDLIFSLELTWVLAWLLASRLKMEDCFASVSPEWFWLWGLLFRLFPPPLQLVVAWILSEPAYAL